MTDESRWSIAPYLFVDCDQPYGCRDFDVEDCNGYRLCFGHTIEGGHRVPTS